MIGTGTWSQCGDHRGDRPVDLLVEAVSLRFRAAHDVPLHVAAATERRQQRAVDGGDRPLQVALEHAVELEVLARGHAQRAVGPLLADVVVRQVRLGRDDAAGDPRPDHQLVVLVEPFGARLFAAVAVILLVDAMEFQQLLGVVAECGRVLEQLLFDEPTQVIAARLDGLVAGEAVERAAVGKVGQTGYASAAWIAWCRERVMPEGMEAGSRGPSRTLG